MGLPGQQKASNAFPQRMWSDSGLCLQKAARALARMSTALGGHQSSAFLFQASPKCRTSIWCQGRQGPTKQDTCKMVMAHSFRESPANPDPLLGLRRTVGLTKDAFGPLHPGFIEAASWHPPEFVQGLGRFPRCRVSPDAGAGFVQGLAGITRCLLLFTRFEVPACWISCAS